MANLADPSPGSDDSPGSDPTAPAEKGNSSDVTHTAAEPTRFYAAATPLESGGSVAPVPLRQLGKYEIQQPLGRGGMGVVWKAFDPDLRRTVAIKVLGEHLMQSPTSRRRFLREARAAAAINHRHVLTIHSVEEDDGVPFLVMEYISGMSLKEYIARKSPLDPLEVLRIGWQIAQGLAAAHAQGVIHRDVKPANVMLDDGATCAQLTDFGLARVAFDNADLTSHDQNVGTPAYMSPESLKGERIDARSDLFSLGCLLYQMLSGHPPFYGRSQGETIHKILDSQPPRLHEIVPTVPEVLSTVVEKLLEKNPDDRLQSAAEVADTFARLLRAVNQAPTDEIPHILRSPLPSNGSVARRSWPRWLAVTAACALLAVVIGILVRNGADSENGQGSLAGPDNGGATNGPEPVPEVIEKFDHITVGSGPDAQFATIAEGVLHANPSATITVQGPGPFEGAVALEGAAHDGLTLVASPRAIWRTPDSGNHRALRIADVAGVTVRGFDFEVQAAGSRALALDGDAQNVLIEDCTFRHMLPEHSLSLVQVATTPSDPTSVVLIRNSRFAAADGPVMCLSLGAGGSAARVECTGCLFEGPNNLVYITEDCRQATLSHNVFLRGSVGINVSYSNWTSDTRLEVVNNTFVGIRYWFGLGDSFRSVLLPPGRTDSRVCNNLILGGHRVQGEDEQWEQVFRAWTFAGNWWEEDDDTKEGADKEGRIATLKSSLPIPERTNAESPDFVQPVADSPVLTSGVGGDLPGYIGARGPRDAAE